MLHDRIKTTYGGRKAMRRALILVLLVLLVLMSSCKDEVLVKIDSDLVGTWIKDSITYTFEENGRFKRSSSSSDEIESLYGKWTTSDGILRLEFDVASINKTLTISNDNPWYVFVRGSNPTYNIYVSESPTSYSPYNKLEGLSPFTFNGSVYVYEEDDDPYHEKCTITIKDSVILVSEKWKGENGGEEYQYQLSYIKGSGTYAYDYKVTNVKYTSYVDIDHYSVSNGILTLNGSNDGYIKQ